ncbi:LCP family protein [Paenibacillus sp. CN-4]|uniref:LCP family protein n=1 Tax=Paenibacillus nanchangensis TaxID=3348343 RepID=UPI0039796F6D
MSSSNGGLPPRKNGQPAGKQTAGKPQPGTVARKPANPKRTKKKKKLTAGRRVLRMFLILLLLAVLGGLGYGAFLYYKLDQGILDTGIDKPVPPGQSAKVKPLTVLLLGTDSRPKHQSYLTDVIMVASLNPDTKSATIVSLPRDTYFDLDGYKTRKINAYYGAFKAQEKEAGNSKAEDAMKKMLGTYLGVPIDYTVVLDFQAFREVVDELGGVSVNVSADMCYKDTADGTNINLKKGPAELDGDKALDYVRYRKSNCKPRTAASDDFDRNRRQSEVLHSLIGKLQSFDGLSKMGDILDAVDNNMLTDIENAQLKDMIAKYWNISKEDVEFVPVTGSWRSPYVYLNESELDRAKQALKNRLAGGTAAP